MLKWHSGINCTAYVSVARLVKQNTDSWFLAYSRTAIVHKFLRCAWGWKKDGWSGTWEAFRLSVCGWSYLSEGWGGGGTLEAAVHS